MHAMHRVRAAGARYAYRLPRFGAGWRATDPPPTEVRMVIESASRVPSSSFIEKVRT